MKLILFVVLLFCAVLGAVSGLIGGAAAVVLFMLLFPLIFILKDFRFGVVAIIVFLPLANITLLGHIPGLNPANVLIAISLGSFFLSKVMYREETVKLPAIVWWRYVLPIALALVVGLTHHGEMTPLMVFRAGEEFGSKLSYTVALGIKPMLILSAAWLIGNAARDSLRPERYLLALICSVVMLASVLLGYILMSGQGLAIIGSARARGFLSPLGLHANEFGAMFATGFAVLLFILPALKNGLYKILLGCVLALTVVALLLTFSRGGYVAALVAVVYFMFTQRRVKLAVGTVATLIVLAIAAPQAIQDRIMTGFGGSEGGHDMMSKQAGDDELTAGRMWMWRQTFPSFYKNPVIGSGLASQAWSDAVKTGVIHTSQTHNLYLSILYDTGIIGLFIILSFFAFVFRNFKMVARKASTPPIIAAALNGAAAALLGYGVMSFTNGRFWPQSEQIYLWFMFGISLAFMSVSERAMSNKVRHAEQIPRRDQMKC